MNPIGVVGEIPDDPRVQEALDKVEGKNIEALAAAAVMDAPPLLLTKYGVTMRPQNLMQGVLISRIMTLGDVDEQYQPWIWLWSLCAPLKSVYESIEKAKNDGLSSLMADVHSWFTGCGIPNEVTKDLMDAVGQTFMLASQLAPKADNTDQGGIKKNAIPGGS